jgi:hypothetical protein
MTVYKTRSVPYWTTSVFSPTVTDLVLIYESVISELRKTIAEWRLTSEWNNESDSWVLCYDRRSVTQSVFGIKHPSGAYDQIFITVWQLLVCWFGAPFLTRGWVCRLQLLLGLASAVIFESESHRTRGNIFLSQIRDFPFRRLLRLSGLRWRYRPRLHTGWNNSGRIE